MQLGSIAPIILQKLEQGSKAVDDLTDQTSNVVFLTDSRSALDALQNQNEPHLNGTLEKRRVVLQWIPAHCGINGNEMADKLAKRGATMTQHDNPIIVKMHSLPICIDFSMETCASTHVTFNLIILICYCTCTN